MKKIRHPVASMVIFAVIIGLFIIVYENMEEKYGITKGDTKTMDITTFNGSVVESEGNIVDQFRAMNLIGGVAQIDSGLTKLTPGSASSFDILGGLAAVAVGAMKTIVGIFTSPYEIPRIIIGYYAGDIPGILAGGMATLAITYLIFILISAYLRSDI